VKARWLALFVLAGCGVDNALVGGRCADGFVSEGNACVSLLPPIDVHVIDPGNAPPPPAVVTGEIDAGSPDSSVVATTVTQEERDAAVQPLVCSDSLVACHGACIPVADDGANCGACGKACMTDQSCVGGACQINCPAARTACGTACADLAMDAGNCGGCGKACAAGETCKGGKCMRPPCGSPGVTCGDTCVMTMTDNANCGACGNACPAGQSCVGGSCEGSGNGDGGGQSNGDGGD